MPLKTYLYLVYFNQPFYKNYDITIPIEEFKRKVKTQVLQKRKYKLSIFNNDNQYFYGMFSGLYGRRLNLKKIKNPKFTFLPHKSKKLEGPGLEIKCNIKAIKPKSFNLKVQFKSISFYFVWVPFVFLTTFIIMLNFVISINSEFNFRLLASAISVFLIIQLIVSIPMIFTIRKDLNEFERIIKME